MAVYCGRLLHAVVLEAPAPWEERVCARHGRRSRDGVGGSSREGERNARIVSVGCRHDCARPVRRRSNRRYGDTRPRGLHGARRAFDRRRAHRPADQGGAGDLGRVAGVRGSWRLLPGSRHDRTGGPRGFRYPVGGEPARALEREAAAIRRRGLQRHRPGHPRRPDPWAADPAEPSGAGLCHVRRRFRSRTHQCQRRVLRAQ